MRVFARATVLLVGCLAVVATPASAQEVQFKGSTTGCFYVASSAPCTSYSSSTSWNFLTFNGGAFNSYTNNSTLAFPGATNSLGTFTLGSTPQEYYNLAFVLNVAFQLPTLVANPNAIYTAALYGYVSNKDGGVHIDFDNTVQSFAFDGPDYQGEFVMRVNDTFVLLNEGTAEIPGDLMVTVVTPEPATIALFATGLAGLIPAVRRRRRKSG
jgi:hypothetical protein